MGLTKQSTGSCAGKQVLRIERSSPQEVVVALGGNPNVGKSTVFNQLTGMKQHTGNWPGKTVCNAIGRYEYHKRSYLLVDIPGTYSLSANSAEEEIARDFLCFGGADVTVIVADATCLERNLHFVLQVREAVSSMVLCVNLMDEAEKKGISIHLERLSSLLNIPVVATSARSKKGLQNLCKAIEAAAHTPSQPQPVTYDETIIQAANELVPKLEPVLPASVSPFWAAVHLLSGEEGIRNSLESHAVAEFPDFQPRPELQEQIVKASVLQAEEIYHQCVSLKTECYHRRDRRLDRLLTSKATGIPAMLLLMGLIFWITMKGANYPSAWLSALLFGLEEPLNHLLSSAPRWLQSLLVDGVWRTLAWVVSVMLPPMAIFFPLFTLLEDSGYLPRIAFNMDHLFCKARAHGKQALSMSMGFGCNACGVIGCRIIDSPRERLIAILTNNFVPCNGRLPTLVALISMFLAGGIPFSSLASALILTGFILLGIVMTLLVSRVLSSTVLSGIPSSFVLELPPYRRPQFGQVILRSVFDRTLFVLGRAAAVAAPAGVVIWLLANISIGDSSILQHCTAFLDPAAQWIGLDGVILLAFLLGFPANEIVIPIILMSYLATGRMVEYESLEQLKELLISNGWTVRTALCTLVLCLFHFPCGTTCQTIYKETKSVKWTAFSMALPTVIGLLLCFFITQAFRLFG
ncbi:MAG: ferrous iron transport protein B [Clostridia bacterium]|nr:ferrous iron transport protein B [Clostridia bacterium]